ncbi:energy transducer TonB [Aurantiacibacter aquimixticola]|uniref:TonB family protein n=1 Tax=Aurantiacibacter aquimixticola TaxID=1958945 RepID=A0A419RR09_9SPHN|nr:TonB family protein [Aurantiacibacter aquimixticola]RJY08207.1 TonB family protein [Aurantiacibacter aquimixticola]
MSYANATPDAGDRAKAAVSVIAIHALLGAGLVTGLAVTGVIAPPTPEFTGTVVVEPLPPLPEETPETPPETSQPPSTVTAPKPPIIFDKPTNIPVEPIRDLPTETVRVPVPKPIPTAEPGPVITPSPAPSFTPVGAVPRNGPAGWITNDDYSNSDLRREREGTARYRLVIGSNGRVNSCEITQSTGHSSLDRATCRLIQSRARFDAATDSSGAQVVGTYNGSVRWQIPE